MDINQTYCGNHFTIDTNNKSLSCIPETNIMLYGNYTSIKKGRLGLVVNVYCKLQGNH